MLEAKTRPADCELREEYTDPDLLPFKLLTSLSINLDASGFSVLSLRELPTAAWLNNFGIFCSSWVKDGLLSGSNSNISCKNF